jgi:hypothetical protein
MRISKRGACVLLFCGSVFAAGPSRSAAQASIQVCRPTITKPITVTTPSQRKAAGKKAQPPLTDMQNGFAWPDSEFGVIKTDAGYEFFASDGATHFGQHGNGNGGSVTRTIGTLDNPVGTASPIDVVIKRNPAHAVDPNYHVYTYLGGGRIYLVPQGMTGAGNLLLVYHAEINTRTSFYSLLGLAESLDNGLSWTDLGEIVRLNQTYQRDLDGFDIGSPQLVTSPDGNYLYVYFPDWIANGTPHVNPTIASVARAAIADVLQAAFGDNPPHAAPFGKYYEGMWNQPGIGGLSTDLNPNSGYGGATNVAWDAELKRYVMIFDDTQTISYSESPDGLAWTLPVPLSRFGIDHRSANYAVPIGSGNDPNILGPQFYVFFTQSGDAGWAGATVKRFTLSCQ